MSSATMRQENFTLLSQKEIAASVYEMKLAGDCSAITQPGQFVNICVPGFFLHRPISVANVERCGIDNAPAAGNGQADILTLIYKVVGQGTAALAAMQPGEIIELLVGLGNGYSLPESGALPEPSAVCAANSSSAAGASRELGASRDARSLKDSYALHASDSSNRSDSRPLLLVGGGVGVPPLYWLAQKLRERGHSVKVILGFNSAVDVFYEQEFSELGCSVTVTTADGSYGLPGFVTAAMPDPSTYAYVYSCGPIPMLRAVAEASGDTPGELSFEERMGCGFGACMGCSHTVLLPDGSRGYKRICVEGPVLRKEEILWK